MIPRRHDGRLCEAAVQLATDRDLFAAPWGAVSGPLEPASLNQPPVTQPQRSSTAELQVTTR